MLDDKTRYLQIAFNYDISLVRKVLPSIQYSPRILVEAGTPYIKREGMDGIRAIKRLWDGHIVADLKTLDGAYSEVRMAKQAGATAATSLGSAPVETLDIFVAACAELGVELDA